MFDQFIIVGPPSLPPTPLRSSSSHDDDDEMIETGVDDGGQRESESKGRDEDANGTKKGNKVEREENEEDICRPSIDFVGSRGTPSRREESKGGDAAIDPIAVGEQEFSGALPLRVLFRYPLLSTELDVPAIEDLCFPHRLPSHVVVEREAEDYRRAVLPPHPSDCFVFITTKEVPAHCRNNTISTSAKPSSPINPPIYPPIYHPTLSHNPQIPTTYSPIYAPYPTPTHTYLPLPRP